MHYKRWPPVRNIRFGPWKARRASRELVGPRGSKVLDPDVMELLFLLAENAEEAVAVDFIIAKLSPLGVTNYDAMTGCISRLREALRDDPRASAYFETAPGKGLQSDKTDYVRFSWPSGPWWKVASAVILGFAALFLLLWLTVPGWRS